MMSMVERNWDNFKKDAQKFERNPVIKNKPSKLWYVLAIFTGIIGGAIGYFVLKKRDKKTANNVLIVSVIATILGSIFDFYVTIPYFFG